MGKARKTKGDQSEEKFKTHTVSEDVPGPAFNDNGYIDIKAELKPEDKVEEETDRFKKQDKPIK